MGPLGIGKKMGDLQAVRPSEAQPISSFVKRGSAAECLGIPEQDGTCLLSRCD